MEKWRERREKKEKKRKKEKIKGKIENGGTQRKGKIITSETSGCMS